MELQVYVRVEYQALESDMGICGDKYRYSDGYASVDDETSVPSSALVVYLVDYVSVDHICAYA